MNLYLLLFDDDLEQLIHTLDLWCRYFI